MARTKFNANDYSNYRFPNVKGFSFTTDDKHAQYLSSQGRYGRRNTGSMVYVFDGYKYDTKDEWLSAMAEANYDMENPNGVHIIPSLKEVLGYTGDKEDLVFDLYARTKVTSNFFKIKTLIIETLTEAERLSNLKSKRSHIKSDELLEEAKRLLPQLNKEHRKSESSLLVNAYFWNLHHDNAHTKSSANAKYNRNDEIRRSWKIVDKEFEIKDFRLKVID
jgi:hypothetical protein